MFDAAYNRILESAVLPIGDRIVGGGFMPWLQQYRKEQFFAAGHLADLQSKRLRQVLEFARGRVLFYRDVPPTDDDPFIAIRRFPILDKAAINDNLDALVTVPREKLIAESSSGSSGVQGTVYMDSYAQASARAMQVLWFEESGYRMGDSVLQSGMTLQRGFVKGLKDFLLNTTYIPAFNLDDKSIERILRDLQKHPRSYLFGYASSLFVLAETALALGINDVSFRYCVSWGDKLFPHYRKKIYDAFGCQTIDLYGCSEGAMIAAQCRWGNYHLGMNQCYVEVVDDEGLPVPAGKMGNVLVTRLDNFAMPLIRYRVGDLVELEDPKDVHCDCGRQFQKLRRIVGRDTDIVVTRSGKKMIVHFFTAIFEHIPEIRQFKVVQKSLDNIEIHYIQGTGFSVETKRSVERQVHSHLNEPFTILWVKTDKIEPTPSGKPQIIQSLIGKSSGASNAA